MDYQDANRAPVQVGRSAAAQEMNCTDEEAAILTRNVKPYKEPERWLSGAVGSVLRALLFNKGAALFLGTLGYWGFGFLSLAFAYEGVAATMFMRTGILPIDMLTTNPMVLWAISFFMVVFGIHDDNGQYQAEGFLETTWMGLGGVVAVVSFAIAFVWGVLMIPIFLISLLAFNSTEPYDMGVLILCAMPAGYVAAFKMSEIQ
jgi:hypothetical protein